VGGFLVSSNRASLKAVLALEDGTLFRGRGFGACRSVVGEVVFNTGMVGYTESITDPSYKGQILAFTYPLLGNYGVPSYEAKEGGIPKYFESDSPKVSGVVCREICEKPSHWASVKTLTEWLNEFGVPGISGVDTRNLTFCLRSKGVMMGALAVSPDEIDVLSLFNDLNSATDYGEMNFFKDVTTREAHQYGDSEKKIVVLDCGTKNGILRNLLQRGYSVVCLPYDADYLQILKYDPRGVLVSNGPGDPVTSTSTILTTKRLVDSGVPVFGVCLGAQVLGLALGAQTFKLKFGHRGQNKPCIDLETGRSYVTSQNHGYSVDFETAKEAKLRPWFVNADDGTLEGVIHESKPALAVQFHPEASPGPFDTTYIFDRFVEVAEEAGNRRR
jgi:carbamoyl-phosphate synthase small subunit